MKQASLLPPKEPDELINGGCPCCEATLPIPIGLPPFLIMQKQRKFLPTFAELLDRLSICQLKEWMIPERRAEYSQEIQDIMNDIDIILEEEKPKIDAKVFRALIVMAQTNFNIWKNEANYRKGISTGNDLELTHSLNGLRNTAKNQIQEVLGGRKDYKIDNLNEKHSQWEVSW